MTVASAGKPGKEWLRISNFSWLHTPAWSGSTVGRMFRLLRLAGRAIIFALKGAGWMAAQVRAAKGLKRRIQVVYRFLPFAGRRWDVVYFPWNSAAITFLPLFDLAKAGVVSCRGSQVNIAPHNPRRVAIREGLRLTFERSTAVHCVSEAMKVEVQGWGLDPKKAQVIYAGADPEFFCPGASVERSKDLFRVVMTGTLSWVKGYEYALSAFRGLLDQGINARLRIIGEGPERQRVLYTIYDLGLEDHVQLLGRLTPDAVRNELHQADAFLLASVSEGISNAALEAMACGLPVVTTDCGGMQEAVRDGIEGFVVSVRDVAAMTGALARLASNSEKCVQMGKAGRKRVLSTFTLRRHVDQFTALLEGISGSLVG
ncbi:MAG: glycosyltransferase family 4 protein [Rhodothermales bacterium]